MPKNLLNVRAHLEHANLIIEGLRKYGMCQLVEDEINKFDLINRSILKKHSKKRKAGNRHDIYVNKG